MLGLLPAGRCSTTCGRRGWLNLSVNRRANPGSVSDMHGQHMLLAVDLFVGYSTVVLWMSGGCAPQFFKYFSTGSELKVFSCAAWRVRKEFRYRFSHLPGERPPTTMYNSAFQICGRSLFSAHCVTETTLRVLVVSLRKELQTTNRWSSWRRFSSTRCAFGERTARLEPKINSACMPLCRATRKVRTRFFPSPQTIDGNTPDARDLFAMLRVFNGTISRQLVCLSARAPVHPVHCLGR